MPADSASNGGPPSNRLARVPGPGPREAGASVRREETVEALTVAFGQLRRGAAALKAENNHLRAEIEALRPEANGRNTGGVSAPEVGQLHGDLDSGTTIVLRIDLTAKTLRLEVENAGTAGAVTSRSVDRREGDGGYGLELVELLTTRWGVSRDHNTSVWLEMGRA